MNLKLAHKAYILVLIPLLFELIFILVLSKLLIDAETEARKAQQAQFVAAQASIIGSKFIAAGSALIAYTASKSDTFARRFSQLEVEIPNEFSLLGRLGRGDTERERLIGEIESTGSQALALMQQAKQLADSGVELEVLRTLRNRVTGTMRKLNQDLQVLCERERKQLLVRPESESKLHGLVEQWLFVGVAVNILLAFALAVYFNRGTLVRLATLVDNARKLARKEELNKPLAGKDEIAYVDRTFHEMADALEKSMRRERVVIEYAMDIICALDESGRLLSISPSCRHILGYSPEQLVGKHFCDLVSVDDSDTTAQSISQIIGSTGTGTFENRMKTANGSSVDLSWSAQWSPKEKTVVCVGHDVSEQRRIERLKREFMQMVSHDLRAPLSSLRVVLDLLVKGMRGKLPEPAATDVSMAERETSRLIALVNDLLDIEKLESGQFKMNFQAVSMRELIACAVDSMEPLAEKRNVKLKIEGDDSMVWGDADRLIQVLINLLSNAIKFTPAGASVEISCQSKEGWTVTYVKDNGPGIPVGHEQTIFNRFYQIDSPNVSSIKEGTGLGLAICKAIVEKHAGTIGVTANQDTGSTFYFRIRTAQPAQPVQLGSK